MLLLVYGPHMNSKYLERREIKYLSSRKAFLLGYGICFSTETRDWKNTMIGIVQSDGEEIEGVLYGLSDEMVKIFDHLEKLSEGKHARIKIKVKLEEGNMEDAYTYICSKKEGNFRLSKEYLNIIVEGAQTNNLSLKYIDYLKSIHQ